MSFGGIAGLFLGFSLLSGVEIIYYFTIRACCMVYREKDDVEKIKLEHARKPKPNYDLSLTPYFKELPVKDGALHTLMEKEDVNPSVVMNRPKDVLIRRSNVNFHEFNAELK